MKRVCLSLMALLILSAGVSVSGCGQKGPLYHPDDQKTSQSRSKDRFEF